MKTSAPIEDDPILNGGTESCFKKNMKLIIAIIAGVVVIGIVVLIVVLATSDSKSEDTQPDTTDHHTDEPQPDTTDHHPDTTDHHTDEPQPDTTDHHTDEPQPDTTDHYTDEPQPDTTDHHTDEPQPDTSDETDIDTSDGPIPEVYEYGLSMEELLQRTDPEYLGTKTLLKADAPEYEALQDGDKEALKYLVMAGFIFENIEYQIDDHHNVPFKKFLEDEVAKGSEQARLTKILFDAQKGINALDSLSHQINLAKNHTQRPGIGVYPEDLTAEEYQEILIKMLKEGMDDEVRNITNQRSMVIRNGEYLKAIDYVDYFKDEFIQIADLLDKAALTSTDANFTEYLKLQADAFRRADPLLDAYADIKWAELQYTPLELTITRENYDDEITNSFIKNEELTQLLKERNITPVPKDCLGFRVGIVNKEGTDVILKIKEFLPVLAENMPYKEEYDQDSSNETIKQTMVDVDLILLAGDVGAYRAGITLAENLPNDDKLSLQMGGGRRNVYHRQIRFTNETQVKKMLDAILDPEQHQYYDSEADHLFTIGHENCHSLGPNIVSSSLGEYKSIIEENKADMCGVAFVDLLTNLSYYSEEQRKKIIVTVVTDSFLKTTPTMAQAHRVRTVMQNYYLYQKDAYYITENDTIHVNIDNVIPATYQMLEEIIRVQLDNNFEKADKYIKDYFVWTNEMEKIGKKLQNLSNVLNCKVENELANKIVSQY